MRRALILAAAVGLLAACGDGDEEYVLRGIPAQAPQTTAAPTTASTTTVAPRVQIVIVRETNIDITQTYTNIEVGVPTETTVAEDPAAVMGVVIAAEEPPITAFTDREELDVDDFYGTCEAARAAGHGDYTVGIDSEYPLYAIEDTDGDGLVCEVYEDV